MAPKWIYRGYVVYPAPLPENVADLKTNTAAIFNQTAGLESLADEMAMFDNAIRLSDDAGVTITHRCINTALTEAMYLALKQAFTARAEDLVGLSWFVVNSSDNTLVDTNTAELPGTILTLDDVYSYLNLVVYQEEQLNE